MSQLPPYQPPSSTPYSGYGYGQPYPPGPNPLAPAKRASIVMFILGGLLLTCGGCFGVFAVIPWEQMPPESQAALLDAVERTGTGLTAQQFFGTLSAVVGIPGLLYILLGFLVRGGGVVTSVLGIVLAGLQGAFQLLMVVQEVVTRQVNVLSLGASALMLLAIGFIILNLVRAIRNAPLVTQMKQGYGQPWPGAQQPYPPAPGYGGGYQPPPPPPPQY